MLSLNPRVISIFAGAYAFGSVIGFGIGNLIQTRKDVKSVEKHHEELINTIDIDIADGEKELNLMLSEIEARRLAKQVDTAINTLGNKEV